MARNGGESPRRKTEFSTKRNRYRARFSLVIEKRRESRGNKCGAITGMKILLVPLRDDI